MSSSAVSFFQRLDVLYLSGEDDIPGGTVKADVFTVGLDSHRQVVCATMYKYCSNVRDLFDYLICNEEP